MSMKPLNKAVATVKNVAKKVPGVLAVALPVVTIAANVANIMSSVRSTEGRLRLASMRYAGVDPITGEFKGEELMKGSGSLIISGIVGQALKALTS